MIARDAMTTKVLSATADMTVRQIATVMVEHNISGVPVVDSSGALIGMVTESDLIAQTASNERTTERASWLALLAEGEPLGAAFLAYLDHSGRMTAREIMTSPIVTVADTADLTEIASLFIGHRIKRVPVMREGHMVGIISRADLVRGMATAKPSGISLPEGTLSEAIASIEKHFSPPHPSPAAKAEKPPENMITASALRDSVEAFDHQKLVEHDQAHQATVDRRKALVKDLIDHHIGDERWQDLLHRAQAAAEAGQKELLLLRFPCELCSDGGRAINSVLADWPETLQGEAAEVYRHWERDLKPNGFHLVAQVLDFPGGKPGDIGLTLVWGA